MAKYFAGLDISQHTTALCVVDAKGALIFETEAAPDGRSIAHALRPYRRVLDVVGHETGPLAPRLHRELELRRLPVVCLDARKVRAGLAAQRNKTDRNDARDIAILLSRGLDAAVHVKGGDATRARALLSLRRAVRNKTRDLARTLSGLLANQACARVATGPKGISVKWAKKTRQDPILVDAVEAALRAHAACKLEADKLDELVRTLAAADTICKRFMTVPGVGPLTAMAFRAAVDDPRRFSDSRRVGAYLGLAPRRRQSGRCDFSTGISKFGDRDARSALFVAAQVLVNHSKSRCALRAWGLKLKARKGARIAYVAVARKLAVVLHRMWVSEMDFNPRPHGL